MSAGKTARFRNVPVAFFPAWDSPANPELAALTVAPPPPGIQILPEQWLVLVKCRDEKQQVVLLERFPREGLACKALLS